MTNNINIRKEYLYLPIQIEKEERLFEIFCLEDNNQKIKVMEFMIPVGEQEGEAYSYDYMARFPVINFTDKTLILKGDVPEAFIKKVVNSSFIPCEPLRRPSVHFTPERGWMNDPNGLVYKDGIYHLYYQYNPCNTSWNNMSWGHATSKDLLHWEEKDIVLTPDEDGMIFSGAALVNERELFELPKDAILYIYSSAGGSNEWGKHKLFTQKVAYSLDYGYTLIKTEIGKLDTICKENRDPKVFWHEESKAYIMCLWLEDNDFAILRSTDLIKWDISDKLTFEEAWECPDLVKLPTEDGEGQWMFWSADGFYYWGEFDGFKFTTDAVKHNAYINKLPYAAQTYSGIKDRVISIAWVRSTHEGRLYTGSMGLPREFSVKTYQGDKYLAQQPIRELMENGKLIYEKQQEYLLNGRFKLQPEEAKVIVIDMVIEQKEQVLIEWNISGIKVSYEIVTGIFTLKEESFQIGGGIQDFSFLLDDVIFEVTANYGIILGVYELPEAKLVIDTDLEQFEIFNVYQIN